MTNIKSAVLFTGTLSLPAAVAIADSSRTAVSSGGFNGGQMAAYRAVLREIYPDRPVSAALLWTDGPRLMALPGALLDRWAP